MSYEYDRYLAQHKSNVQKGYRWIAENLPDLFYDGIDYDWQIGFCHDTSKSTPDEYDA